MSKLKNQLGIATKLEANYRLSRRPGSPLTKKEFIKERYFHPGAFVDAPKHAIYGGRIQKHKGRIAYLQVYHAHEGEVIRLVEVDELSTMSGEIWHG